MNEKNTKVKWMNNFYFLRQDAAAKKWGHKTPEKIRKKWQKDLKNDTKKVLTQFSSSGNLGSSRMVSKQGRFSFSFILDWIKENWSKQSVFHRFLLKKLWIDHFWMFAVWAQKWDFLSSIYSLSVTIWRRERNKWIEEAQNTFQPGRKRYDFDLRRRDC